MNNQARYNSRRGRTRRRRGQYIVGNMGHPQNGGGPGQALVPFPFPPPPVVAYPAYGQVPYPAPQQPYMYPPPNGPAVYQNAVPLGQQPYAHPVPAYMPPYPQSQVNQAAQDQAYMPQLTQGGGNYPAQVPGQHHGLRLRRRRRGRVQARGRGRGNGRGSRGQPNRRQAGRDNNSVRQAAQVVQQSSSEAGVAERNPLPALPVPLEQSSGLDSRGIKQEDTDNESALVAQNIGSTEIKREPVIKQEPQ
ncbi:hypothetical protein FCIRC_4486 [Fusarium circinatum]|uniref:Uncharacterized protein n=1 Tax=Fusarium circinatum TaxID=48490 RepID=A0A8H5U646_FUSCI|nr:hypothetical protein FCIRC_4486 [Fusarium circinatum]